MGIHIPLWLLLSPAVIAVWCFVGFLMTVLVFAIEPGVAFGLSRAQRRIMIWCGPLTVGMAIALLIERIRYRK